MLHGRSSARLLRETILHPTKKRYDAIRAAYASALNALTSYRPSTLNVLAEKIEIITAEYDGCEVPLEYLDAFLADVRHMAGEARA